jgi:serine/threonine protein kinase
MPVGSSTCNSHQPQERIENCNKVIKNKLENTDPYKCISRDNKLHINDSVVHLTNLIGSGMFGETYRGHINDYDVVVKKFNNNDMINAKNEVKIVKFLSDVVLMNNISPHFLALYADFTCNKSSTIQLRIVPNYNLLVMEKADGSLANLLMNSNISDKMLQCIITQIILSIYTFHQYTHCYHNDTHIGNILYTYSNDSNKYIGYIFQKQKYLVPSYNYTMILWDFGLAEPMIKNSIYHEMIPQYKNMIDFLFDYVFLIDGLNKHTNYIKKLRAKVMEYNSKIIRLFNNTIIAQKQSDVNILLQYETKFIQELITENLIALEAYNENNYDVDTYYDLDVQKGGLRLTLSEDTKQRIQFKLNPMMQHPMMQFPMMQHPMMQFPAMQHPMMQHPMMQFPMMQFPVMQQPMIVQQPMIPGGKKKSKKTKKPQTKKRSSTK